jgi:hypothetical protein
MKAGLDRKGDEAAPQEIPLYRLVGNGNSARRAPGI